MGRKINWGLSNCPDERIPPEGNQESLLQQEKAFSASPSGDTFNRAHIYFHKPQFDKTEHMCYFIREG